MGRARDGFASLVGCFAWRLLTIPAVLSMSRAVVADFPPSRGSGWLPGAGSPSGLLPLDWSRGDELAHTTCALFLIPSSTSPPPAHASRRRLHLPGRTVGKR